MKLLNKFKFSLPPLPASPPVHAPDRTTLLQLASVILIAVLFHFSIASPITAIFAFAVWTLKTALIYRRAANPPRLLIIVLTILSLLMILIFYGGWNGQKAGYSFLVLLLTLKFLESYSMRDYCVVCLLLFFVASSSFLFSYSVLSIVIVISYTIAVTSLLLKLSNPAPSTWLSTFGVAGTIMLKALPMAVILFFFFPRISGSFGFIPSQDDLGSDNKLSNSLIAADFASVAFNNALAFRVEFDDQIPANKQLYWRAKVMTEEHNFGWVVTLPTMAELRRARARNSSAQNDQGSVGYEIVHEDTGDHFAPFLDYALKQSIGVQLDDYSVFLSRESKGVFGYRGISNPQPNLVSSPAIDRNQLLTTRSTPTARILALLSRWRSESSTDRELAQTVYQHFADNDFHYTLDPPGLGKNPLDEFLFDTQTGYCGHYASAFTILMRWLGVPARVVVGYQGGSKNQVGNFLEVRYSDAHAWSEVWLDDQWQRFDPTSAISPERIDFGMDALMALWESNSLGSSATGRALADFLNPTGFSKTYRRLRETWGNIGYQWNKWVINYDFDSQRRLLESLGLKHFNSVFTLIMLVTAGTLLLMLFYFWRLIPRPTKIGEAQRTYLDFVHRFKRHRIVKALSDTPHEFAHKARLGFPMQAQEISDITDTYVKIRYGRESSYYESAHPKTKPLQLFKQQVKRFKLKPADHRPE